MTESKTTRRMALTIVVALGSYLLLTSVFYPLSFLSVFDAKRLLQLVMFAVLLLFAVSYKPLRKATEEQLSRIPKYVGFAICAFFLIGIASSLRLSHPAYALVDVSMMFVMLILVFIAAASRNLARLQFDKWAVLFLAAMGLGVAFQELVGYLVGWVMGIEFNYQQMLIHFASPRFYNQLQTWSIPVLAALPLIFPERKWIKPACITLIGLQWFLVFSTGARGTFISLIIAMVFIAFWLPANRRFWLKLQISSLFIGIIFYAGIMLLNNIFIHQSSETTSRSGDFYRQSVGRPMMHTSGRSMLWSVSINDAKRHSFLGTGPTRYGCEDSSSSKTIPSHPHSFPMRIMGEWGFAALILLMFLVVTIGIKFLGGLRNQHKSTLQDHHKGHYYDSALQSILAISALAGAIHACLSGLLIMPASQIEMILIAGWVLNVTHISGKNRKGKPITSIVLLTGLLLSTFQLTFAFKEIPLFPVRTGYSEKAVVLFPRFWWVGKTCDYQYPDFTE